jgi:gluconolactonase
MTGTVFQHNKRAMYTGIIAVLSVLAACSSTGVPEWNAANERLIEEYTLPQRIRDDIPDTGIPPSMSPGATVSFQDRAEVEIAPGATGRLSWGAGVMLNRMVLQPGAEIPRETLEAERIMIVLKGSVEQLVSGTYVIMSAFDSEPMTPISGRRGKMEFIYLERGAEHALKAGESGAEILECYSPVRLDLLRKAGIDHVPPGTVNSAPAAQPSIMPNRVYDYFDVQFTELARGAWSRLIAGKHMQLSFLRMDPSTEFRHSNQPEEQVRLVLRGSVEQIILDHDTSMSVNDMAYIPGRMVHRETTGAVGCDVLDVFWPVRPDYTSRMNTRRAAYHEIIPEGEQIELVVDGAVSGPGLCYTEGPTWMNGKLYISSMGYDEIWTGSPANSAFVEMDPDGTYRYRGTGMEVNGTFPLGNGNLAVCDMYGRRVIEMTLKGDVVRVLADTYDGQRFDGPNDLAVDNNGGIYFSDPQVVPEPHYQPGRAVYYRRPHGEVIRVLEPGTLEKPNGLILSPDCTVLYINSTPENFMLAFDVNDDGSLANPRKFGTLRLTPEVLDRESIYPQVDGMTVDERGNVYISSILGLQIFSPDGRFAGSIHFPLMPVNCCFGDEDGKTLYVTCNDKVYKIRTNVRGAAYTLN